MGRVFGRDVRLPVLYEIGTLWQCQLCWRWWRCVDIPPNLPGGGYHGGGRLWKPVRWWNFHDRRRIRDNPVGNDLIANLTLPARRR